MYVLFEVLQKKLNIYEPTIVAYDMHIKTAQIFHMLMKIM